MTEYEIKQIRLYRQHLTNPADKFTVLHDLNGLQCQFMVNAYHALKIRCREPLSEDSFGEGLVKNWTVRGTVHIFAEDDLPLYKHKGEDNDYLSHQWNGVRFWQGGDMSPERQEYFARLIVERVSCGIAEREKLKEACFSAGMTEEEEGYVFEPWGGMIRSLCERGFLCYKVQEKKAYRIAPVFAPMKTADAELEMARRYFLHYAPVTVRDAAYYFGWTQTRVKQIMASLPLNQFTSDGVTYYYLEALETDVPDIPKVIFLAGFDQLMLGYQKKDSMFLPQEYLRAVFNLAGIVMPPLLIDGTVAGRWRRKGGKLTLEMFREPYDKQPILDQAEETFGELRKIEFTAI